MYGGTVLRSTPFFTFSQTGESHDRNMDFDNSNRANLFSDNDVVMSRTINALAFTIGLLLVLTIFMPVGIHAHTIYNCTDPAGVQMADAGGSVAAAVAQRDSHTISGNQGCTINNNLGASCSYLSGTDVETDTHDVWHATYSTFKYYICNTGSPYADTCPVDFTDNGDGSCSPPLPPYDCSGNSGVQATFMCSSSGQTLSEAAAGANSCNEGAADPNGCELEPTVGGNSSECVNTTPPISQGGGPPFSVSCSHDLTGLGTNADPSDNLPETDNDGGTPQIQEEISHTDTDDGVCQVSTTQLKTVQGNNDGTLTTCYQTVDTSTGASCPTLGVITDESCTTTYTDGSETTTETNTTVDGGGTQTGQTTSTTNTGAGNLYTQAEEGDNGSASGGGSCTVAFICSGDVIQCAIAEQVYLSRCDFEDSLTGYTPTEEGDVVDNTSSEFSDTYTEITGATGWLTNRQCPVIPAVTVMGASIEWDFAPLCEAFSALSFLVLGFASFVGVRIFAGAF